MTRTDLLAPPQRAGAGRHFEIIKRIRAVRATVAFVAEVDGVLSSLAREEADRATRTWLAARRRDGVGRGELADLTLSYYDKARRRYRPTFELDYRLGGAARTCSYRGGQTFLRWLRRRRPAHVRSFRVSFAGPSTRLVVLLRPGRIAERSYLWAVGNDGPRIERLVAALDAAVKRASGRRRWTRSWHFNYVLATVASLPFAVGLAFRLRHIARASALTASIGADVTLALGLVFLYRVAWPPIICYFDGAGARRLRAALKILYVTVFALFAATGGWAILTTLFRIRW